MKSSKAEMTAVAAAEQEAKKATAAAKRRKTRLRQQGAKDIWLQTTKIIVPAWFGNCSVEDGFRLSETFTAAGLLALVCVGEAGRTSGDCRHACEVSMMMKLRPSGFDRQEARDLAGKGFFELRKNKLVRLSKRPTLDFEYAYYTLSKKGQKWYDLIEKSAGCAAESDDE